MFINPKNITTVTTDLDSMIKEYSTQQMDAWRQIPYWAMKATTIDNGEEKTIDGYLWRQMSSTPLELFTRIRAFRFGYWGVSWDNCANRFTLAVDLENGQLLEMYELTQYNTSLIAEPKHVNILGGSINELDAVQLLHNLKVKNSLLTISKKSQEWQDKALLKYSLSPYGYVRP